MNENELDLTKEVLDEFLAHYGVAGQKWGVRRSSKQLARSNSGITKYKEKAKTLTDAELNTRIKRLETEKKYRELNKKTVSAGQKHVNEVLVHIGKSLLMKLLLVIWSVLRLVIKSHVMGFCYDRMPCK